jgi:hypothetical protein
MNIEYRLGITARCPLDENLTDIYHLTVRSNETILVESILGAVEHFTRKPVYQEELTELLAQALGADVEIIGTHKTVEVTSRAET